MLNLFEQRYTWNKQHGKACYDVVLFTDYNDAFDMTSVEVRQNDQKQTWQKKDNTTMCLLMCTNISCSLFRIQKISKETVSILANVKYNFEKQNA